MNLSTNQISPETIFITPTKKLKSHSVIPNSEGVKKQLPISNSIEDRLKANVNVVEKLNTSQRQRMKSRKKLKTQSSLDSRSSKKQILHMIQQKLKWKQHSPVSAKTSSKPNVEHKLKQVQQMLGKVKEWNFDSLQKINHLKSSQTDQHNKSMTHLHWQDASGQSKSIRKSQVLIEKYQQFNIKGAKLQYSGQSMKKVYRPPEYIKPGWMHSSTKKSNMSSSSKYLLYEPRECKQFSTQNKSASRSSKCNCSCHEIH